MHKVQDPGRRSTDLWQEARRNLETCTSLATITGHADSSGDDTTVDTRYGAPISLRKAMRQRAWRGEALTYTNIMLGLLAASHCRWDVVKTTLVNLDRSLIPEAHTAMKALVIYLKGAYHQGTGDVKAALATFSSSCFDYPTTGTGVRSGLRELALLAGMNQLWLMQHPSCRNSARTSDLIDQLQPLCTHHPNLDLRMIWHNMMAALDTEPKQLLNEQKAHMQEGINIQKKTKNVLEATITLCIMRSRFFQDVVGDQALKSALAAANQAHKSGNLLWRAVASGLLAHSYEVQGYRDEAVKEWDKAVGEARGAFSAGV